MISTILATMAIGQAPKPTFTMILVSGNEHPIKEMKDIDESPSDTMTARIQELTRGMDGAKKTWMLIEGSVIGDHVPLNQSPIIFVVSREPEASSAIRETATVNGKPVVMTGEKTSSVSTLTLSFGVPRQDRISGGSYVNSRIGSDGPNLMLTSLATALYANKERRKDETEYFKNSIAISRDSLNDTEDWLATFKGDIRPTMVLAASGRPQDGRRDLLAFPPTGVILTYQVTFDKRWSAELKDIIRVK